MAKRKNRYPHLISTGMMKFQGRQTVRNMLVITVLTADAYFSAFYVPMLVTPARLSIASRPVDYSFFFRAGQNLPDRTRIEKLASKHQVTVTDYVSEPSATLAIDGYEEVETKGKVGITFTKKYQETLSECRFFSESAWNALTGEHLNLEPGTVASVFNSEGGSGGLISNDISRITNPVTGQSLSVRPVESVLKNDLLFQCRVIDDSDYASLSKGLTDEWKETQVFFNVKNDCYAFSKELFYEIVSSSGPEAALPDGYDRIVRKRLLSNGEEYFFDPENAEKYDIPVIQYDQPDSFVFRQNWLYMPKFRILDQSDFTTTMAVFLLLFIFISLLCFTAVGVILFTRSLTLCITNEEIYNNLKKLGASSAWLQKTARRQVSRVFLSPVTIGTFLILAFYLLILAANGENGITPYGWAGFGLCMTIVAAISSLIYGLYRATLKTVYRKLKIEG